MGEGIACAVDGADLTGCRQWRRRWMDEGNECVLSCRCFSPENTITRICPFVDVSMPSSSSSVLLAVSPRVLVSQSLSSSPPSSYEASSSSLAMSAAVPSNPVLILSFDSSLTHIQFLYPPPPPLPPPLFRSRERTLTLTQAEEERDFYEARHRNTEDG